MTEEERKRQEELAKRHQEIVGLWRSGIQDFKEIAIRLNAPRGAVERALIREGLVQDRPRGPRVSRLSPDYERHVQWRKRAELKRQEAEERRKAAATRVG